MLCPAKLREVAQWKKKSDKNLKIWVVLKTRQIKINIGPSGGTIVLLTQHPMKIGGFLINVDKRSMLLDYTFPFFFVNVVCERPLNCTVFELDSKKMYLEGLLYFPIHHNTVYWLVFKMGSESERRCLSWTSKAEGKTVTYTTVAILFTTFLLIIWFRTQLKF